MCFFLELSGSEMVKAGMEIIRLAWNHVMNKNFFVIIKKSSWNYNKILLF